MATIDAGVVRTSKAVELVSDVSEVAVHDARPISTKADHRLKVPVTTLPYSPETSPTNDSGDQPLVADIIPRVGA